MSERPRILVVDDDLVCVRMLRFNLQACGYAVEIACDGKEALQKTDDETFDLVITDEAMPVMNGQEMCRHLRSDARYATTPIIFLTARTFELDEGQICDELQIAAVISKPFSPHSLLAKIDSELRQQGHTELAAP